MFGLENGVGVGGGELGGEDVPGAEADLFWKISKIQKLKTFFL